MESLLLRIASLWVALMVGPASGFATGKKPPNIVFIFSDDHAYQAISAYGDARKLIETPNIDRIGREGIIFNRCLVPKLTTRRDTKDFSRANPHGKNLVHLRYQRYMHDYLAFVKALDENVGQVLQYLDDEGLSENTLVVYSIDQGPQGA